MCRVGQNHIYTVYIRYFGRKITKFTVIYGVYIRFWPTLYMWYVFKEHKKLYKRCSQRVNALPVATRWEQHRARDTTYFMRRMKSARAASCSSPSIASDSVIPTHNTDEIKCSFRLTPSTGYKIKYNYSVFFSFDVINAKGNPIMSRTLLVTRPVWVSTHTHTHAHTHIHIHPVWVNTSATY
jgi:hypothetical protein